MILTEEINLFRETVRHLWNSYLRRDADDDSVDTFHAICLQLFEDQITSRLELSAPPIPMDGRQIPLDQYRLFAPNRGSVPPSIPLFLNRDIPPSGYWDYPIDWIPQEEKTIITPISFFDFDLYGWRKLEFYRVRIQNCPTHPEINGRDALVKCEYLELEVTESEDPTSV